MTVTSSWIIVNLVGSELSLLDDSANRGSPIGSHLRIVGSIASDRPRVVIGQATLVVVVFISRISGAECDILVHTRAGHVPRKSSSLEVLGMGRCNDSPDANHTSRRTAISGTQAGAWGRSSLEVCWRNEWSRRVLLSKLYIIHMNAI